MGVIERDEQSRAINWSNSLAYFAGHGQLWLNLLGRDPQGVVHPQDEAEEVRDTLIKALPAKLRDPQSGGAVIERVYRKEELYSGQYLFCAPDLVVIFAPGCAPSPRSTLIDFDEEIFTTPAADEYASAGVNPSLVKGVLLASAPGLAPSVRATEPAPLTGVVPTLLHALGIEYAAVEGSVIAALFSPAYLETHPIRSSTGDQGLSEDDEELIINRLRDLGYV
jgi:predicted AlkP superfamily phosphohydrolase/phosphomutase